MTLKPARRLYPVDIDFLARERVDSGSDVTRKVLTAQPETGARTSIVHLAPGSVWQPSDASFWTELWVRTGSVRDAETTLRAGSYYLLAPGETRPQLQALESSSVLWFSDIDGPQMAKQTVRLTAEAVAELPQRRPPGSPEGVFEAVLSSGSGGSVTRLLRVLPFVATGVVAHDHSEEVFLLEGSYKMGDEFHATGTYTCKGPQVDHGPFLTSTGYMGLEVRNFANG